MLARYRVKSLRENLGYGIWLITSSSASVSSRETNIDATTATDLKSYKGCHICIVTLACGKQLISPNVKIRSDLSTCARVPAIKINVKLPDPLAHLKAPKTQDMNQIVNIAQPIAKRMTLIKPRFEKELNSLVPWKTSLAISIFSFIGSMTLHFLFFYIYHRFHAVQKLIPKFLKVGEEKVHVKPVLSADVPDTFTANETLDTTGRKYFIIGNDFGKRSKTLFSRVNSTRLLATSVGETLFHPSSPPECFMEETAS